VAKAADDAKEAKWFSVKELTKLAFDHDEIINFALLKHKLK
jgi:8-oxo-dGTP diphosphatase